MTPSSSARVEPRQITRGKGWYVLITWPAGNSEQISGFATEVEVERWIKTKSTAWLEARQAAING
jgi:hypothetical protein